MSISAVQQNNKITKNFLL